MALERWKESRGMHPWSPLKELERMERRLEHMISSMPRMGDGFWMPAIEISEKDDKFMVKAELPGIQKEDIDVSIVGDTLTIKGERKTEEETKGKGYYRSELLYGSFYRSVALPAKVDASKIEATFTNGVLEITAPKAPEALPQKVDVSVK